MVRETVVSPVSSPGASKRPTNLTLSLEALANAERAAAERGTSISQLVDDLLTALPVFGDSHELDRLAPSVRRLLGVARGAGEGAEDRREFLYRKYGAHR